MGAWAKEPLVQWAPAPVFNGAPVLFRSPTFSGTATWLGKKIEFRPDPAGNGFVALAGVNLGRPRGRYRLTLGDESVLVTVRAKSYPSGSNRVPPKYVEPPREVRRQIAEESEIKKAVFGASMPERLWSGAFAAPVEARHTSSFGKRRVYNGKTRSVHQGLDFNAKLGTAVAAANTGRVVIARPMYYEGGLVVIDHGESIFTLYLHQSEILVKEGSAVAKGQTVGLSGATGRVTGPHLHFALRWQGTYLDPATLLGLWGPQEG